MAFSPSPSASRKKKSSKGTEETLLKREFQISESFLEYQQVKDTGTTTTDVYLICSDGIVPVHAFVLQSVSSFFGMMFRAQGDYYFGHRPVIIPDWSVAQISRMIQFIYTGFTMVIGKERDEMKQMLEFFLISVDPEDIKSEKRRTKTPLSAKNQVLCFRGTEANDYRCSTANSVGKMPQSNGMKRKGDSDDTDLPPGAKRISVTRKGEGTLDKDVIVVMPVNKSISAPSSTKKSKVTKVSRKPHHDPDRISSTDSSEGEIDWVETKNSDWFMKEACRCQRCDKQYPNPSEASSCLTNNHNRLRCYLCFKVVRTTAKLFNHFAKKHKQGAREQTLLCSWCDQTVPFKSVSCHVISLHLTGMITVGTNPARNNRLQGRRRGPIGVFPVKDAAGNAVSTNQAKPGSVKDKAEAATAPESNKASEFRMTNKNGKPENDEEDDHAALLKSEKQTIRIKSICGKTRVFVVNLKR